MPVAAISDFVNKKSCFLRIFSQMKRKLGTQLGMASTLIWGEALLKDPELSIHSEMV